MNTETQPSDANDPDDEPVIVTVHLFDAPREQLWTAFTTPEHVVHWYGGKGFTNPKCEMDVRPGGHWRHVMRTPDGSEFAFDYVFVEVAPPGKLSWQDADYGQRKSGHPAGLNTVTFEDLGGKTRLTMTARFQSKADRDRAKSNGFSRVLAEGMAKMEQVLKRMKTS